jgi:hypothetical protein
MAFQDDNQVALIIVICIFFVVSVYYFLVAKHHQKFSKDELKTMFYAHVMKRKDFFGVYLRSYYLPTYPIWLLVS